MSRWPRILQLIARGLFVGGTLWSSDAAAEDYVITIAEARSGSEQAVESRLQAPLAGSICDQVDRYARISRACTTESFSTAVDTHWSRRLHANDIDIAIISEQDRDNAWKSMTVSQETPSRGLRHVLRVSQEKVLVSSSAVTAKVVSDVLRVIMEKAAPLGASHAEFVSLDLKKRSAWLDGRNGVPLHEGTWGAMQSFGLEAEPPVWLIIGSYRSPAEANKDISFLIRELSKESDDENLDSLRESGLQLRLGRNEYYGLIAGAATTRSGAGTRKAKLIESLSFIPRDSYPFPALKGWGPDLLYPSRPRSRR